MKDWTGNKKSTFATIGASNHSKHELQHRDYYATDPRTIPPLLKQLTRDGINFETVWENAAGGGHLSRELGRHGYDVFESDIEPQSKNVYALDFLHGYGDVPKCDAIITNPPYRYAQEWVEQSLAHLDEGQYLILFLKLTFLEGQKRRKMFEKYPPKYVYVFSRRQKCAINGDFDKTGSSATAYEWYVWEKGFTGAPQIKWID